MFSPETEEGAVDPTVLQGHLDEAKRQAADYFDQLLRLKAEFENYRKRMEREKSEARLWGKQEVLTPLLGLIDVFDQALAHVDRAQEMKQVVQGLEFLHKNFSSFVKAEGLEPLEVLGKPLNPEMAEAVEQEEVPSDQVGTVVGEIQKGYRFQGRVLRPARVRVGVAKKS